jgi:hypothetical protein
MLAIKQPIEHCHVPEPCIDEKDSQGVVEEQDEKSQDLDHGDLIRPLVKAHPLA